MIAGKQTFPENISGGTLGETHTTENHGKLTCLGTEIGFPYYSNEVCDEDGTITGEALEPYRTAEGATVYPIAGTRSSYYSLEVALEENLRKSTKFFGGLGYEMNVNNDETFDVELNHLGMNFVNGKATWNETVAKANALINKAA